jgi:hypothetical protein
MSLILVNLYFIFDLKSFDLGSSSFDFDSPGLDLELFGLGLELSGLGLEFSGFHVLEYISATNYRWYKSKHIHHHQHHPHIELKMPLKTQQKFSAVSN